MKPYYLLALLAACAPKQAVESPAASSPLDVRPTIGEPAAFEAPVAQTFTLSNGITVWHYPQKELPLVSVRIQVEGGSSADPKALPGLTSFADDMLEYGAGDLDAAAFAEKVEQLAIDVGVSTGGRYSVMNFDGESSKLDDGLDLLQSMMTAPLFDEGEMEKMRTQLVAGIEMTKSNPSALASMAMDQAWYGADHPLAHPVSGSVESVNEITREDLESSWSSRVNASTLSIIVTGAYDEAALKAGLESRFGSIEGESSASAEIPAPSMLGQKIFVDNPGASQTVLLVAVPGFGANTAEYTAANLASIVLGGTFTSRLNRLLREEKGYTYGARARASRDRSSGKIQLSTAVRQDATAESLTDLLSQLALWSNEGITDAELVKAQGAQKTRMIGSIETIDGVADAMSGRLGLGLGPDALERERGSAERERLEMVNSLLNALTITSPVVVVVGDLSVIRTPVEEAVPGEWTEMSF